jgi:hypothetical protein
VTRRISLGCALLAILLAACRQTVVLDDLSADASLSGTGGRNVSGGSGGSRPTDASTDGSCAAGPQILATGDVPQVVVALDRSSEMLGTQFGEMQNDSQFTVAVSDLSAEVGSYSPNGQHSNHRAISFSYLEFPEGATCASSGCCSSDVTPTISYQDFTNATMHCLLSTSTCGPSINNHPIAAALLAAYNHFSQPGANGVQPPEERYVLLVTDDAPDGNCSAENDCQLAQDQVYNLASTLNVTTVVIHVGTGDSTNGTNCLQNFAVIQGAPPSWYGNPDLYYPAPMPQDLQSAIGTAIGTGSSTGIAAGTCRFTLSTTPTSLSQLTVVIPGATGTTGTTTPTQDSKNGWTYEAPSGIPRLILHGNACTSYLNSQFGGVQVFQGCAPDHTTNP